MALTTNKFAAATAVAAAFSLLATPAMALDLPRPATVKAYDGEALDAENRRRGRGWHHDDDDFDTGDVVAGVLILGAIAAIAGAAQSGNERERYEERYPIPQDEPDYVPPAAAGRLDGVGMANAVDACIGEVERGSGPVGSVDAASRSVEGWHVSGSLAGGEPFSCSIAGDGSVSGVEVGTYETGFQPEADDGSFEIAKAQ